jgi:hypothetical protein
MKVKDLIAQFRVENNDRAEPFFWSDGDVKGWLNEAEAEAAIRARLIRETVNPDVCQIVVTAGNANYPLHAALYEIEYIAFVGGDDAKRRPIRLISEGDMTREDCDWRERIGVPRRAIQSDTSLRLVPNPYAPGVVVLEGYRLPIDKLEGDDDEPEIHEAHHRHLLRWVEFKAYGIPDTESFDAQRSAEALAEFEAYFGLRPQADLRRSTRTDVPQVVKAFMP